MFQIRCTLRRQAGLSLIELLVAIAIVGILAVVAVPSYSKFIRKGESDTAWSDLQALSLALEGRFRRTLSYPATPATNNTQSVSQLVASWAPASKASAFSFQYQLMDAGAGKYRVSSVGQSTSNFNNCTLILEAVRGTVTRYCNDPAACKLTCDRAP
jgi:prepilin-type N-terminal cleavage/methylation domain-containing protein